MMVNNRSEVLTNNNDVTQAWRYSRPSFSSAFVGSISACPVGMCGIPVQATRWYESVLSCNRCIFKTLMVDHTYMYLKELELQTLMKLWVCTGLYIDISNFWRSLLTKKLSIGHSTLPPKSWVLTLNTMSLQWLLSSNIHNKGPPFMYWETTL